jgi:integrase
VKEPKTFPHEYQSNGLVFRIYSAPQLQTAADGTKTRYPSYLVKYYDGAKLTSKRHKSWDDVESFVEEVVAAVRKNDPERLELTGRDRRIYLAAVETLKPLGQEVDQAAREYLAAARLLEPHKLTVVKAVEIVSEALTRLQGKASLSTALDFYERHGVVMTSVKNVPDVVQELVAGLEKDGCGDYHVTSMADRLDRFAETFTGPINEVLEVEITTWLQNLKKIVWQKKGKKSGRVESNAPVSRRTRNNYRDAIHELFEFARKRKYLPKDLKTEAAEISRVKVIPGKNHIISPDEARRVLNVLSPHLIPYTVLKLFSGLRTEEAFGLSWEELRFQSKAVIIEAWLAKLRQRRVPPILPNLAVWLKPFEGSKGRIARGYSSPQSVHKAVAREASRMGVKLGRNTFRNCYISYRVAQPTAPSTVAAETGTSIRMIESNYKELATPDEAEQWFSVQPNDERLATLKEYSESLKTS